MSNDVFKESVLKICEEDDRYHPDAYFFVRDALDATVANIKKQNKDEYRHVTGRELLEGLRIFALQELGPMAATVFDEWGLKKTSDVGAIVFNLIAEGRLGKTDNDSIEDFKDVYDFDEVFRKPYRPAGRVKTAASRGKRSKRTENR